MPAPNLGPQYDLASRLSALEDQVRRMTQNPLGQALSATQSDGSVGWQVYTDPSTGSQAMVFYQGPTTARDPNTGLHQALAYFGELFSGGAAQDSGILFYRPTGTQTAIIGNRGMQVYDPKHNQVFGTDEYGASPSEEGLRNPTLPLSTPVATSVSLWPQTVSSSGGQIAWSQFVAQHAQVSWIAQCYADTGTNGSVSLTLYGPNGQTVTGPSTAVTGGSFVYANDALTLPAGFWQQPWTASVNASITSGTGKVYAQTISLYGVGSS